MADRIMADLAKLAPPDIEEPPDGPEEVTLHIGGFTSRCGNCGGNADPDEIAHDMARMGGDGCGATYTHVAADKLGPFAEANTRALRPDLTYRGAS